QDVEWVRPMKLNAGEKLELLARADVEGRRLTVEGLLRQLQEWAEGNVGAKGAIFAALKGDLESQVRRAEIERREQNDLLAAMRKAYGRGMVDEAPLEVQGAMRRLETMKQSLEEAKHSLY